MPAEVQANVMDFFGDLPDPRMNRTRRHELPDILVIAICAIICGAEDWVSVALFGRCKEAWFRSFLRLPHGIPSHDTFGRVFSALGPKAFSERFTRWVQAISEVTEGDVVAIDGKTLRRSFDRASSKAAIHMVSAWSRANGLVLGQVKTAAKSNEVTAIPRLLELLDIKGCIVTIDAAGCQKAVAEKIVNSGADYVLSLKGNQPTLHNEAVAYFEEGLKTGMCGSKHDHVIEENNDHGRFERRETWSTDEVDWLPNRQQWPSVRSAAIVISTRTSQGKTTEERRYYISSLPGDDAGKIADAIRGHWSIENSLHWTLDVAFREDESRARKDNAAQNLAILRHIALNLVKNEKTRRVGVKNSRLKAGWDEGYLLKILGF